MSVWTNGPGRSTSEMSWSASGWASAGQLGFTSATIQAPGSKPSTISAGSNCLALSMIYSGQADRMPIWIAMLPGSNCTAGSSIACKQLSAKR